MTGICVWSTIFAILTISVLCLGNVQAQGSTRDFGEYEIWRFESANDFVVGSDNQFTNGFTFQKHSGLYSSLDATRGTLAFGKWLVRVFLPEKSGLYSREWWGGGQNMRTPDDIDNRNIILNDVPCVGMLAWTKSFIAFDDREFHGFQWMLGWVGPEVYAEDTQKFVHDIIGSDDPQSWDLQLKNEPVLNLYYAWKHKLRRNRSFDGAFNVNATDSNFLLAAEVSLETRFGRLNDGFTYVSEPTGRGINYDAMIPRDDGRAAIYGSIVTRARYNGRAIGTDRPPSRTSSGRTARSSCTGLRRGAPSAS